MSKKSSDRKNLFVNELELNSTGLFNSQLGLVSNLGKFAWFSAAILILAFILPLYKKAVPIAIVLVFVARIMEQLTAPEHFQKTIRGKSRTMMLMVLFYLLHVLGMLWSSNVDFGLKDLEYKLSFLILPMLFFPLSTKDLLLWRKAAYLFILGYATYMVITLGMSAFVFFQSREPSVFFYSELSRWMHPSYQAMYGAWAVFLVIRLSNGSFNLRRIIIILSLLMFIVLLASKSGFISAFLALLGGMLFLWKDKSLNPTNGLLLVLMASLFISAVLLTPKSSSRVSAAIEYVQSDESEQASADKVAVPKKDSNSMRMLVWQISWDEMLKHPFGVGTGDVKDHLIESYKDSGEKVIANKRLNPHNQFLQSGVALGFPGLFLCLMMMIYPIYLLLKNNRWGLAFFFGLMIFNCLVESMLEVQSGIVFFTFWAVLLLNNYKVPKPLNN